MSKMKKLIMIVMIVLVSCLLITMNFEVKATGASDAPMNLDLSLDTTDPSPAPSTSPTPSTSPEPQNQAQVIQPTTNLTENNASNTLPKTGVTEDITVMFFIVVCAVSAVYAYKKIRDYKA